MAGLRKTILGVFAVDPPANAIEYSGLWWTWQDLSSILAEFEGILDDARLGAGTRVGVLLRNVPACVSAMASVTSSGRCLVTLNPDLPAEKIVDDITKLHLPVIVGTACDWSRADVVDAARKAGALGIRLPARAGDPVELVEGLDKVRASDAPTAEGTAVEMLTSGTTGTPKRIPLKASLLEKMLTDAAIYEKDRNNDDPPRLRKGVNFVMVPFAHMGGLWSVMNTLVSGRQTFLMEKFEMESFLNGMRRHRPRALSTPPAIVRMVLDAGVAKADLESLAAWRTSTAPLDPALADTFYEKYGVPVLQVYGATEFAGGVAGWTLADFKAQAQDKRGSVGRLNPGIEGRIVHPETRDPVPAGEEGVLSVRASHLGNGKDWLDTTDRAVIDEDGFLFIKGRYDNMILRGGFKVMPDDVVRAMERHPAIREAAVVGIPDERLGEVPVAAYIPRTGATAPEDEELRDFLRQHLSAYQVPAQLRAVSELPRTPSMKVSAAALQELFTAASTQRDASLTA